MQRRESSNGANVARMVNTSSWLIWALLSATFAALTAIFAKVGLEGVDSDLATLIRTFVIVLALGAFVFATAKWANPLSLRPKTLLFLVLSGLATGASCCATSGRWK